MDKLKEQKLLESKTLSHGQQWNFTVYKVYLTEVSLKETSLTFLLPITILQKVDF